MGLLLPFDILDIICPTHVLCVVFPQFALKFELLSLTFVEPPLFHSPFHTYKLNFLKKRKLVVMTMLPAKWNTDFRID